ncbi:MAG: hypothetical protein ACQEXX_24985 [Bacillota bacterium]
MEEEQLLSVERLKKSKCKWTYKFYTLNKHDLMSNEVSNNQSPRLIRLDLYPLSLVYPAFPKRHLHHYMIISGVKKNEYLMLDPYFKFQAPIKEELIIRAANSKEIERGGESLTLSRETTNLFSIEDVQIQLLNEWKDKLNIYMEGQDTRGEKAITTGVPAIVQLKQGFEQTLDCYLEKGLFQDQMWKQLAERLMISLVNEREGMVTFLERYGHKLFDLEPTLLSEIRESARLMRLMIYSINKGIVRKLHFKEMMSICYSALKVILKQELKVHKQVHLSYLKEERR